MESKEMRLAKKAKKLIDEFERVQSVLLSGELSEQEVEIRDDGVTIVLKNIMPGYSGEAIFKLTHISDVVKSYIDDMDEENDEMIKSYEVENTNWHESDLGDIYREAAMEHLEKVEVVQDKVRHTYKELKKIEEKAREIEGL
ncbi:hypothetical protein P5F71_15110 [Clostridium perfringens]|nr:hypothetical protein [Clostridium perfringens]MDK0984350.1 hypothetical protein [Clostridium perfringens]